MSSAARSQLIPGPCTCWYCFRKEAHPSTHVEFVKINGVLACTRCAHVVPKEREEEVRGKIRVPVPPCGMGYPVAFLSSFLNREQKDSLMEWMTGQTVGECDGRMYDHEHKCYNPTGCGPHGIVIYTGDLYRWLKGLPVVD